MWRLRKRRLQPPRMQPGPPPAPPAGPAGAPRPSDASTCDASTTGLVGRPVGPCVLRHQHDGPVHRDANGTTWSPSPGCTRAELVDQAARVLLEVWLQRAEEHVIASAEEHCRELAGAAVDALLRPVPGGRPLPAEPFREPRTEADRE